MCCVYNCTLLYYIYGGTSVLHGVINDYSLGSCPQCVGAPVKQEMPVHCLFSSSPLYT